MRTKSLIELREIDLEILENIDEYKLMFLARSVFPNAKYPQQTLYSYLQKYLRLGLIEKLSRGQYTITEDGLYFINILRKLRDRNI